MKFKLSFLGVLAFCTFFIWSVALGAAPGVLSVSFLNVGQGDAIFIESPSGRQMLVDGGPNRSVLRELGKVMSFSDRSIDILVATHPDADHIGGLPEVLERFEVGVIVETEATNDTQIFEEYREAVLREDAAQISARRGQVIDMGDGVYVRILFPDRELQGDIGNDGSIIMQVVYGETEVLLSGDAGQSIEQHVVTFEGEGLASDILKAGHHGSKTSSALAFVTAVAPEYAVISAECESRYSHPHEEVLQTLQNISDEVLGTCENGTIVFVSDGKSFTRK